MAAEVKIKETLDDVCAEVARPLLAFALRNPRDVSVQAAALYDKAADAVVGRSLRREDSSLYKRLVQLFEDRNAVVHRAHLIEAARAREDVDAARKVMEWADGLQQAN